MHIEGSPLESEKTTARMVPLRARGKNVIAVLPLQACLDGMRIRNVAGYESAEPLSEDQWLYFLRRSPAEILSPAQTVLVDHAVSFNQIGALVCGVHHTISTPLSSEFLLRAPSPRQTHAEIVDHAFRASLSPLSSARLESPQLHVCAHLIAKRVKSDSTPNDLAQLIMKLWHSRNDDALRQLLCSNLILAERVIACASDMSAGQKLTIDTAIRALGLTRTVAVMVVAALCLQHSGSIVSREWHLAALRRAYRIAELCLTIASANDVEPMEAFLVGLLTCVGTSALYCWQPEVVRNMHRQELFNRHLPCEAIERQWLGVTQRQISSWIVQEAGLCGSLVEALDQFEQGRHNLPALAKVLRQAAFIDSQSFRYNAFSWPPPI